MARKDPPAESRRKQGEVRKPDPKAARTHYGSAPNTAGGDDVVGGGGGGRGGGGGKTRGGRSGHRGPGTEKQD